MQTLVHAFWKALGRKNLMFSWPFWKFLWPFGIFVAILVHFSTFWYVIERKIWQPWRPISLFNESELYVQKTLKSKL
jgi:hypothetical protein